MILVVGITPGRDNIASSAALGRMFLFQDYTGIFLKRQESLRAPPLLIIAPLLLLFGLVQS